MRKLAATIFRCIAVFFKGDTIEYDPHPEELGYTRIPDSQMMRMTHKWGLLFFSLCMLMPMIEVHEPFGFTLPIERNTLMLSCLVFFVLFTRSVSVVKNGKRKCSCCSRRMEIYPGVERSTYKYVCHRCQTYIDIPVANYTDP